jgi:hypothetical protein
MTSLGLGVAIAAFAVTPSSADPKEDLKKCIDAHLERAMIAKPSLVEFTATLDKLCNADAMNKKVEDDFPATGSAIVDAQAATFKAQMRKLNEQYAADSKGLAVSYYSKIQQAWRKAGIDTR